MIGLLFANESFMDGFRFFGGPPWPGGAALIGWGRLGSKGWIRLWGGPPWPGGAASGLGEQVISFPAAPGGHPARD